MRRVIATLTALAGLACALPVAAQFAKPEDAVKYRKGAFQVMGAHFGRIGAMVNGKAPFDAAAAASNAEIAAFASKLPYAGFVEGTSSTEKGGPKPIVWSERPKFDDYAKKMQDEMGKLLVSARGGNQEQIKASFDTTAKACKSCHDDFRNP